MNIFLVECKSCDDGCRETLAAFSTREAADELATRTGGGVRAVVLDAPMPDIFRCSAVWYEKDNAVRVWTCRHGVGAEFPADETSRTQLVGGSSVSVSTYARTRDYALARLKGIWADRNMPPFEDGAVEGYPE